MLSNNAVINENEEKNTYHLPACRQKEMNYIQTSWKTTS